MAHATLLSAFLQVLSFVFQAGGQDEKNSLSSPQSANHRLTILSLEYGDSTKNVLIVARTPSGLYGIATLDLFQQRLEWVVQDRKEQPHILKGSTPDFICWKEVDHNEGDLLSFYCIPGSSMPRPVYLQQMGIMRQAIPVAVVSQEQALLVHRYSKDKWYSLRLRHEYLLIYPGSKRKEVLLAESKVIDGGPLNVSRPLGARENFICIAERHGSSSWPFVPQSDSMHLRVVTLNPPGVLVTLRFEYGRPIQVYPCAIDNSIAIAIVKDSYTASESYAVTIANLPSSGTEQIVLQRSIPVPRLSGLVDIIWADNAVLLVQQNPSVVSFLHEEDDYQEVNELARGNKSDSGYIVASYKAQVAISDGVTIVVWELSNKVPTKLYEFIPRDNSAAN